MGGYISRLTLKPLTNKNIYCKIFNFKYILKIFNFIYLPADSSSHPDSFFNSHWCFKNQRQGRDQYFCTAFGFYCQPVQ